MPSEQLLKEMGNYNQELVKAGIMLAGEGLHPTSKGARIKFSGTRRTVIDGPFAETKELIAGYWLWRVKSMQDAIEWAKRCPNPTGEESVLGNPSDLRGRLTSMKGSLLNSESRRSAFAPKPNSCRIKRYRALPV